MPSPIRRSARGQLGPASSTTSSHSSRQDRGTRTNQTQKSATPRSLSSEDLSEPPVARRSQRQPATKEEGSAKDTETVEDNDEEAIDEEDITRCICGQQEYPGPPLSEAFADIPNAQAEEIGGLFILCDGCSVWQHGGCVGIVEESQSPDKYFCEECRPKQHALSRDSRGQKYSLYIPLHPKAQRRGSTSKQDDKPKKDRPSAEPRASVDPSTGKRRGTIRSKELDDEEEQLRQAIEESKLEGGTGPVRRNGKRARDDSSEDSKQEVKRQRRASELVPSMPHVASIEDESDDPDSTSNSRVKKAKADAAQSARQVQQAEKENEREKARVEAASRRQDRARSRRGEDADGNEETTPKPTSSGKVSPPAPSSQPPTPPPAEKAPIRRGPGKKQGKKLGNNQYTKRNLEQATSSPYGRNRQLQIQATQGSGDEGSEIIVNGGTNGNMDKQSPGVACTSLNTNGKGKFGRGRKAMANGNGVKGSAPGEEVERTFTNMHLVLQNISAYVTKQQDETNATTTTMANEAGSPNGVSAAQAPSTASVSSLADQNFYELSSTDMAIQLQANIEEWQRKWGHLAST